MTGLKIKKYLDDNGIRYSFVSEKTGIPMNVLSPILNAKRKMSVEEYFLICIALNKEPNDFSDLKKHPQQKTG